MPSLSHTASDLKRDQFTHQDLGQMQMDVNCFDRQVKRPDELPTVGIVLCRRKNDALVELNLPQDATCFASKHPLDLPSKEELKVRLEQITHDLNGSPNAMNPGYQPTAPCFGSDVSGPKYQTFSVICSVG